MADELENKQLSKDVRLFFFCYKVANWIGVAPPLLKTSSKMKQYVYMLYILILIGFYTTFSVDQVLGRAEIYMQDENLFYIVITVDIILDFSLFISVINCLLFTMTRPKLWGDFVKKLRASEKEFNRHGLKNVGDSNDLRLEMTRTTLLTFSTIALTLTAFIAHAQEDLNLEKYYVDLVLYNFYNLFAILYISNTAELIAVRYNFLSEFLTNVVTKEILQIRACQQIMGINALYIKLNGLMEKYDKIVGWPIFFVPAHTILMILQSFNYCFFRNNMQFEMSWNFWALFIGVSLNWLILTIVIVMACDAVENSGKKFTKTCYLLQEGMAKTQVRDELEHLGVFSEKLCPAFYAAGFYKVNQRVLAAIFSIVTTYSIIAIQFNTSH